MCTKMTGILNLLTMSLPVPGTDIAAIHTTLHAEGIYIIGKKSNPNHGMVYEVFI